MAPASDGGCCVVVPVYNAYEATARCLASLERHTPPHHRVLLVDDASTDPRIAVLLREFATRRGNAAVLAQPQNVGFVGSANRGLAEAGGDAILLNSDTEVTAGWVESMVRCRRSNPAIGIVCPLSNEATILSLEGVADLYRAGDGSVDVDALGDCVRRAARREYPRLPTAVGFCMLVTRELLDAVGAFDPAFGRGYGEENDLSMRALARGFEIACSDDVYVHHAGSASFGQGAGIQGERERNRVLLVRRWPGYAPAVAQWWRRNPLRPAIERVNAAAERERLPGRPRVLLVTHRLEGLGGIEQQTRALLDHAADSAAFTIVAPLPSQGVWPDLLVERTGAGRVARFTLELATRGLHAMGTPAEARDDEVEASFRRLLAGGFDVVHFQSVIGWNTLHLPRLARESGARVVVSIHDKAWMCADFNMVLGRDGGPCGRIAARGSDAGCVACIATKAAAPQDRTAAQVAAWLEARHATAADALAGADLIVCPSQYAAAAVRRAFGDALPTRIVAHGVPEWPPLPASDARGSLRVAYLGRFSVRKGGQVLIEAARQLAGRPITFEAWGPIDDALRDAAMAAGIGARGAYANEDLPKVLQGVDLVVVPTLLDETYCLVVSESQQLGVPVAASAAGAIPERVREEESGFVFPPGDAAALARLLLRLCDDRTLLDRVRSHLRSHRCRTHAENAREYLALYRARAHS